MATIGEMLTELAGVKQDIKTSLAGKGQVVGNDFTTYADAVDDISTGTVKENKILVIISSNHQDSEGWSDDCWEGGAADITNYTKHYTPLSVHITSPVIEISYDDRISDDYIINTGSQDILEQSEAAVWDYAYGTGTYIVTYLDGIQLINYVNQLANTYNLTIDEWTLEDEAIVTHYLCQGSECNDYYDEGYAAGYADYPDYGTTPNPEYEDDCEGTWDGGYTDGFNAAQSEAEGGGDEPEPEPEE